MPVAKFSKRAVLVVIAVLAVFALILTILACTLSYWYVQDDGVNPKGTAGLWQYCIKYASAPGATAEECYNWSILTDSTCKAYLMAAQALSLSGIGLLVITLALAAISMKLNKAGLLLAVVTFLAFGCTLVCWSLWMAFAEKTCTTTNNIVFGPLNWYGACFIIQCIASGLSLFLLCFSCALQSMYVREKAFAKKQEMDAPKLLLPLNPAPTMSPTTHNNHMNTQSFPAAPPAMQETMPSKQAKPSAPPAPPSPQPPSRPDPPHAPRPDPGDDGSDSLGSPSSGAASLHQPPGLWGGLPLPHPLQPSDPWAPRVTYYYHIPAPIPPPPAFTPFPPPGFPPPAQFPVTPPAARFPVTPPAARFSTTPPAARRPHIDPNMDPVSAPAFNPI